MFFSLSSENEFESNYMNNNYKDFDNHKFLNKNSNNKNYSLTLKRFVTICFAKYIFYLILTFFPNFFFSLPNEKDLQAHACNIANNLRDHEDSFLKGLANVTNKHLKRKDSIFETFVGYLHRDPHLMSLAKVYPDPQDRSQLVTSFILLTRGPKSKNKFDILNSALVCFVKNHKMSKTATGIKKGKNFSLQHGIPC